eukprot:2145378-Prymnesium_polylepis.1
MSSVTCRRSARVPRGEEGARAQCRKRWARSGRRGGRCAGAVRGRRCAGVRCAGVRCADVR